MRSTLLLSSPLSPLSRGKYLNDNGELWPGFRRLPSPLLHLTSPLAIVFSSPSKTTLSLPPLCQSPYLFWLACLSNEPSINDMCLQMHNVCVCHNVIIIISGENFNDSSLHGSPDTNRWEPLSHTMVVMMNFVWNAMNDVHCESSVPYTMRTSP